MSLNIKDNKFDDKLNQLLENEELKKYHTILLTNSCRVRVNPDDYLMTEDFILVSPYFNLPRSIYIYGKAEETNSEDNIYLNYWFDVFSKTIEKGNIIPQQFKKSEIKYELTIGLSKEFRGRAYNYNTWDKNNIIEFLCCLFNSTLQEAKFQQQDLLDQMVA